MKKSIWVTMTALGTLAAVNLITLIPTANAGTSDALAQAFARPPAWARPWVYWFPLSGNLSSNGITLDLEAMKRVGIGGVLYMEVDQGAPAGPAQFGSPQWRALFKHACEEAHRLGLEVNMNNDAGWCGSGGPWITPDLAMQKLVWTETAVEGPRQFNTTLPQPQSVANYYRDIAVLAFPTPAGNARIENLNGKAVFTPLVHLAC
ncbi:MAG: glycosyl hydrolase family 43, partial [Candidatus Omnitrophica bacterium]|nr:glycosyl hydrolase family 43 [Candidatus Omnitrophota bacterium]